VLYGAVLFFNGNKDMNIDRSLVARAFIKAGEEPITEAEWEDGTSSRVRTVYEVYLAMLLDSLSLYDWTSQKKRARLEALTEEDDEENLTNYAYMYPIPADCAKIVMVGDNKEYNVEGAFIFTNEADAVLLYIQNYFTGKYAFKIVELPVEADIANYYIKNEEGEYEPAETWDPAETYYEIDEQDYNFYAQPNLDPILSSYFECRLAAAIALKLTGGTDKYQMLYNEAALIANNAMKKSAEQARNRSHGNEWWTKQLGME